MNLVECINSVLKGARNLPITALVKATFYILNELFTRKRAKAEAWINTEHETSTLIASTGRMRYLKCVRCQVEWSMPSTSIDNDVTVVSSRWTEFLVDMCLHVVQISD
ncbi:hypothetical protein Ahy_A01g000185 [Arachis hypogaea]|uniref:Uncharacterized protein n=1 Tax=Arachis hypogaea TaxID=3818 RepID=A0A445EJV4_ARAHY|nr:hypothetical protein Ahy_A01g000185 [Arachis hypogaea]